MKAAIIFAAGMLGLAVISAQTPARDIPGVAGVGTGTITGTVVADDETHAPVRRATLTLVRAGVSDTRLIASDDRGRFLFDTLPAGVYTLNATKGGYLVANYGAAKPGLPGMPIPLADGQHFTADPIAITRGAVVTGRVVDGTGLPVAEVAVYATPFEVVDGVRRRRNTSIPPPRFTSNAHGTYRIYGLPAGAYLVTAMPSLPYPLPATVTAAELQWAQHAGNTAEASRPADLAAASADGGPAPGRSVADAPTFYPASADAANAAVVSLAPGDERDGIDIRLQSVPLARVRGIIVGPDGQPVPNATIVRAAKAEPFAGPVTGGVAERSLPDGTFILRIGVPPGEHIVSVRAAAPGTGVRDAGFWGRADLTVNGEDISNLAIQLFPTMTFAGSVVFEGEAAAPANLTGIGLRFTPAPETPVPFGTFAGSVLADRTFKIGGIEPAKYRLIVTLSIALAGAHPWGVKSATFNGKNLLDDWVEFHQGEDVTGVVITLSDRQTELTGTLVDASGQPTPQFYLLAFPTDRTKWTPDSRWIKLVRADAKGGYRMTGLPAGEYYVCAMTELDPAQQYDPGFLEQVIPASIKVTLNDGEPQTRTLRVGAPR